MDGKKRAAAMAAVYAYIRTGEEHQVQVMAEPVDATEAGALVCKAAGGPGVNIWGLTGRQFQMQANTMMQLRMFK